MKLTSSNGSPSILSIFYGLLFGGLLGGILVTEFRSVIFVGQISLDVEAMMRNTAVYVLPAVALASFTVVPIMVRYKKIHFVGFTIAGILSGCVVGVLYALATEMFGWFSEASSKSVGYVMFSAIVVAWAVWLIQLIVDSLES